MFKETSGKIAIFHSISFECSVTQHTAKEVPCHIF